MTTHSAYLLTTSHLGKDDLGDLLRLIASVGAALDAGEVARLHHIILLQGCSAAQCAEVRQQLPAWVELMSTQASLSSPAARNQMIRHMVEKRDFAAEAFVAFPDDDAWYPSGTLACIARHFGEQRELQLMLTRYGPNPSADGCDKAFSPTLQQALSRGACAAIFARAALVAKLGGFHELLGLGTVLSGGEDTEFVHRAFHLAKGHSLCVPGSLVGHAAAAPVKKARYYEGGLAAIMAHGRVSRDARIAVMRKLAVGSLLVLRGRMSVADYVRAVRLARANAEAVRGGSAAPLEYEHPGGRASPL